MACDRHLKQQFTKGINEDIMTGKNIKELTTLKKELMSW